MKAPLRSLAALPILLAALVLTASQGTTAQLGRERFDCVAYVPVNVTCPLEGFVREKVDGAVFEDEARWLEARSAAVAPGWETYIGTAGSKIPDLDVVELVGKVVPRMGLAASGGGLRATLNTAGVVSALDGREPKTRNSLTAGIRGLLTYFAGISGGSWTTGSLSHNEFRPVSEWLTTLKLETGLLVPGESDAAKAVSLRNIFKCVDAKEAAGFPTSAADLYQRSLAMGLLDNTEPPEGIEAALNFTLSGMVSEQLGNPVATAQAPLPIIESGLYSKAADQVSNVSLGAWGDVLVPWEASPFWSGSRHPDIASFVKTRYMGTPTRACAEGGMATVGYDALAFIMAGSGLYVGADMDFGSPEAQALQKFAAIFPTPFDFDIANPFGSEGDLFLTDSGLGDFGSTPLLSLLLPSRQVQVIFMVDSSGPQETNTFPNGTELVTLSKYSREVMGYPFPSVPSSAEDFVSQGLNTGVTFFGCDEAAPTIVYIPNQMVTFASNVSTFKFAYTDDEIEGMIDNGFAQLTDNPTAPEADTAIACLLISTVGQRPPSCASLLREYCWTPDGSNGAIGGDVDSNGCLTAAGEVWCIALSKCIRPWEEACSPGSERDEETSAAPTILAATIWGVFFRCLVACVLAGSPVWLL